MRSLLSVLAFLSLAAASIYSPSISRCGVSSSNINPSTLINISQAWAQIFPPDRARELELAGSESGMNVLRINLIGETGENIVGFSNETGKLGRSTSIKSDQMYLVPSADNTTIEPCSDPLSKDRGPHLQCLVHRDIPVQLALPRLSPSLPVHPAEHDLLPAHRRPPRHQHLGPAFTPLRTSHLGK